jgi:two-component system chemotaxis response regulator CheB
MAEMLASIPREFPAAIAFAMHRALGKPDLLVELLRKCTTRVAVNAAKDGDALFPGMVYVCPAGMHMTAGHALRLLEGPRLNYVRPSADLMFVSVARVHGPRAIGVVLSGMGTDGAVGCKSIVDAGGVVIAQDPASAEFPNMPIAAAALGPARWVLPPGEIGPALARLLEGPDFCRPDVGPGLVGEGGSKRPATKVLLADDHRIVLDGLRALLNGEDDLAVFPRDAEDGRAAVRLSAELGPDVVVMDLAMPRLDGVAATRQILFHNPAAKVVALSAHADARMTDRVLRAGASAVLSKQKAYTELADAIRSVMAGHIYISRHGHSATVRPAGRA